MSGVKGQPTILFDNDGVLVDTEHLFYRASAEILRGVGVELTERRFIEVSLGEGRSNFDALRERGYSRDAIEELRAERDRLYERMLCENELLVEGAAETLRALHGRVRMGVVTSCRRRHFELIHSRGGLLEWMEFAVVREDYERVKPAPDGYLTALRRHGLDAADCWVIEDSPRGLRAAKAAGLRCAVIPNGLTAGSAFEGADRVLGSIREAAALVGM